MDGDKTFSVDLKSCSCSCSDWKIYGLPCKHDSACIESKSFLVCQFCDNFFKMKKYQRPYIGLIYHISTFGMHEVISMKKNTIYAPTVRSQPGRRMNERILFQVEHRVTKFERCNRQGHNKRI